MRTEDRGLEIKMFVCIILTQFDQRYVALVLEPTHNARFTAIMDKNMPKWRQYRDELNWLPLRMEATE